MLDGLHLGIDDVVARLLSDERRRLERAHVIWVESVALFSKEKVTLERKII